MNTGVETETEVKMKTEMKMGLEVKEKTEAEAALEAKTKIEAEVASEAKTKIEAKTASEAKMKIETEMDIVAEAIVKIETRVDIEAEKQIMGMEDMTDNHLIRKLIVQEMTVNPDRKNFSKNGCTDKIIKYEDIKSGERIDDLERNGFRIIQNPSFFCYGLDSILLSEFAFSNKKHVNKAIDFCTGSGVIPLLLLARNKVNDVTGLEIQEDVAEMAMRSTFLNEVEAKCHILGGRYGDIRYVRENFKPESFDAVTCNPPYIAGGAGLKNAVDSLNIARHEITMNLSDVIDGASYLLKEGGTFSMVHKPFRIAEIIFLMHKYRLEPKVLRLVEPVRGKEANMVLIEGVKGAREWLKVMPTLTVYDLNGNYTEEVLKIYGKK